jgi:hypothetical protein
LRSVSSQRFLDVEALRRLDVLQIDAAESEFEKLAHLYDLIRVMSVNLDVEDVHIGEPLE